MKKPDRTDPKYAWFWKPIETEWLDHEYEHDYRMFKISITDLDSLEFVELMELEATAERYIASHNKTIKGFRKDLKKAQAQLDKADADLIAYNNSSKMADIDSFGKYLEPIEMIFSRRAGENYDGVYSDISAITSHLKKINSWLERVRFKCSTLRQKQEAKSAKTDRLEELELLRDIEELKILRAREERAHEAKTIEGLQKIATSGGGKNDG